jgi:hypothetical protein
MVMYRSLPPTESAAVLESGMGAYLALEEERRVQPTPREREELANAFFAALRPPPPHAPHHQMSDEEEDAEAEAEAELEVESEAENEDEPAPDSGMSDD